MSAAKFTDPGPEDSDAWLAESGAELEAELQRAAQAGADSGGAAGVGSGSGCAAAAEAPEAQLDQVSKRLQVPAWWLPCTQLVASRMRGRSAYAPVSAIAKQIIGWNAWHGEAIVCASCSQAFLQESSSYEGADAAAIADADGAAGASTVQDSFCGDIPEAIALRSNLSSRMLHEMLREVQSQQLSDCGTRRRG